MNRPPLLEMAISHMKKQPRWSNGEVATIWTSSNGKIQMWLSCDSQQQVRLQMFRDSNRLNSRIYSQELTVANLNVPNAPFPVGLGNDFENWFVKAFNEVMAPRYLELSS